MARFFLYLILILFFFSSCRTTKYVPDDEYLLDKYTIRQEGDGVKKEELENYIRQKPNKKILGFKFHLALYNLSNIEKEGWWHRSLRTIGEEPVIYDELMADKTSDQLEIFLRNKGFYQSEVIDTVEFSRKKANIVYTIRPNQAYFIRSINYRIADPAIEELIKADSANSLLSAGEVFDMDILSAERERIETHLKDRGYYYFSREFVFYEADSSRTGQEVNIKLVINKYRQFRPDGSFIEMDHPKIRIGEVYMHTAYNPAEALNNPELYSSRQDTIRINSISLLFDNELKVKPGVISESSYLIPGENYSLENVKRTYRNLSSLQVFRLVNIEFSETGRTDENGLLFMDCNVFLTPQTLQSYAIEVQGTNSSGNIGAAGSIIYQHRNIFGGAENLDLRLRGALETLRESYRDNFGNMVEFGSELTINIPKFFLPFRTDQFIRKFNPKTSFSAAYNYQRRPDYTRTVANVSFGYNWKGNRYLTHIIKPVEVNLVSIPFRSQEFIDWIEGKYISFSYEPHLVGVASYSLIYSNQDIRKSRDHIFFRTNLESAGNLLYGFYRTAGIEDVDGTYQLFNTDFAQYVRADIDFRYYNVLDENSSLVYRFFAGAGLPYNNSTALPFEKKYFAGGANSIRAWQVRNLGPGSYNEIETTSFPNKTADIQLEANVEYRFKLFWVLEGALFVDAGNIWAINTDDEREGALFEFDRFHKEIAVGTGFGTRFVFSFFTFRLDLGVKARDPVLPEGNRWILGRQKMTSDDFTLNIGIGYPF